MGIENENQFIPEGEQKNVKLRELKELSEEEHAQFEEAENVLNLNRHSANRTGASKNESEAYIEAIETIKKLGVREGREILFRRGLNDRDNYVQSKTAEALGEIGLPQDLKAMRLKYRQYSGEHEGIDLAKAMKKIEERFGIKE